MDDGETKTTQRLCYFCQSPGPQFSEPVKAKETEQQVSQVWICDSCKENKSFDSMTYGERTDADSEKYLEELHRRIHDEKSYLKKSWKDLKESLDILYQAKLGVTEAIALLVPRQRELESHVERCCFDNHIQLLQRLDNQCRGHIVVSKRRILGLALTPKKTNPELSIQYSTKFLTCALDDWEKYDQVARAVSSILYQMEIACNIHWKTQARCIYHRIVYTNIDIHEKLRSSNTRVQQEANLCDEKKDYRYRGILRRYRKYEEEMTLAANDRSPDVCRPTFGDEWSIEGDRLDAYRDHLLLSDSSGTESIPENISEDNSESSNFDQSPIDFKNHTSSDLLLNNFFDAEHDESGYNGDYCGQKCPPSPDGSSISTSETTESSDSFEADSDFHPTDIPREVIAMLCQQPGKNGLHPSPGQLANLEEPVTNGSGEKPSDLFGKTLEHIKNLSKKTNDEDDQTQARPRAVPRKGATRKMPDGECVSPDGHGHSHDGHGGHSHSECNKEDCIDCDYSDNEDDHHDHGHDHHDHHHHDHDSFNDHTPCHCVHCELLGNTPTHRGNIRDELMRDRLRKKLKKRKEQKEKTNVTSRPSLEDAPSPSLSSSTQSRDKSEVDLYRKGTGNGGKGTNGKKVPFGFSMAMEVRPVRSSTSSKNHDNQEENDWKREWIELAFEEFREVAIREKMQVPSSTSLLSLQNCLRGAIRSRLKSKDPEFSAFVAEVELLAMIDRENEEKERKKRERKKKKKKKQQENKTEEERENYEIEEKTEMENGEMEISIVKNGKEEDIDGIFTPIDDIDNLDPDDRDVEIFKKFCLDCAPIFPRLKLPLQSLNLLPLVEPH